MVKEQVVICIDNSEWMRNGDYIPTRMEAQNEAANLICGAKTQQNPETTVALLTMASKSPSVQVSLTTNLGKLLACLTTISINGKTQFINSIRVAQLALKRRNTEQNQGGSRRIIIFIGSPIVEGEEELVILGSKLKKSNISVDVINFGEETINTKKLEAFINSVMNEEKDSHLLTIPPGPHILSDIILTSPIVSVEGGTVNPNIGGSSSDGFDYGGIDPNVEPDLAFALRMSIEDENRRKEKEKLEKQKSSETSKEEKKEEKKLKKQKLKFQINKQVVVKILKIFKKKKMIKKWMIKLLMKL